MGRTMLDQELITTHLGTARHEILSLIPAWPTPLRSAYLRPHNGRYRCRRSRTVVARSCRMRAPRPADERAGHWELRLGDDFPDFLLVIDRRTALYQSAGHRASGTGPVVRSGAELDGLIGLFEEHWASASPIIPAACTAVSELQRSIIDHLAKGMTDEAAANALEISPRTVQRHVSTMMARLGARSRLELGVYLATADLV